MQTQQCEICQRPIFENAEHNPLCERIRTLEAQVRELRGEKPKEEKKEEPPIGDLQGNEPAGAGAERTVPRFEKDPSHHDKEKPPQLSQPA